jgi:hypothetical protein
VEAPVLDKSIKRVRGERLRESTGQDFGYDASQWRAWLTNDGRIPIRDDLGHEKWSAKKQRMTAPESSRMYAGLLLAGELAPEQYAWMVTPTMVLLDDEEMKRCVCGHQRPAVGSVDGVVAARFSPFA